MQEVPFKKTNQEKEGEPKSSRYEYECEKIIRLQLRTGVRD